jgi:Di-haem oxidoreductase, putative peroxidase
LGSQVPGGKPEIPYKAAWGAANELPYFITGFFTTMRQAVLAHSGEALKTRRNFQDLKESEQDALIEFLKSLQVLPPGTKDLIVDENYQKRDWPPSCSH